MKEYKIKLFVSAIGPKREKSKTTYLNFYGEKIDVPYIVWFIEGADRNIIIDSGCSAEDYLIIAEEKKKKGLVSHAAFKNVQDVIPFDEGLSNIFGITPDDVDVIIMTHLHWDHCMGVKRCKNAKVIIQEEEWKGVHNHHPLSDGSYAPKWIYEEIKNLELIKGDVELFPGIRAILTPGHSPGGQSIAINTNKGEYVISGFCSVRDNFYPPKEIQQATGLPVIGCGVHIDSTVSYDNTLKLVQMFGDRILPCHEPALMKINAIP